MTRLSYVFPCLAGILRFPLFHSTANSDSVYGLIWLGLFISITSFLICSIQFVLQWQNERKCITCKIINLPNSLAIIGNLIGSCDLLILLYIAYNEKENTWTTILCTYSQGQLITGLIYDLTGYFWINIQKPTAQSLSGLVFLLFGSLLLQLLIYADYKTHLQNSLNILFAFTAGCLSVISVVSCRKISVTFYSYWSGTFVYCSEQLLIFFIVSMINISSYKTYPSSVSFISNIILSSIGCILVLACTQFFGDRGGIFAALGPVAGGQILAVELWRFNSITVFKIFALIAVIIGSILTWNGRWYYQENPLTK